MTDYNDGKFHIWGNNSAPEGVHAESLVTHVWHDDETGHFGLVENTRAGLIICWKHVLKFRVTKPHREPRVIWLNEYPDGGISQSTEENARKIAGPNAIRTAVRYVEAPE